MVSSLSAKLLNLWRKSSVILPNSRSHGCISAGFVPPPVTPLSDDDLLRPPSNVPSLICSIIRVTSSSLPAASSFSCFLVIFVSPESMLRFVSGESLPIATIAFATCASRFMVAVETSYCSASLVAVFCLGCWGSF